MNTRTRKEDVKSANVKGSEPQGAEKRAESTYTGAMDVKFLGADGKNHTVRTIVNHALDVEKRGNNVGTELLFLAKQVGKDRFLEIDEQIRHDNKWRKPPKGTSEEKKAEYRATPSTWRNAVSIIRQSFEKKLDVKAFANLYGSDSLNAKLQELKGKQQRNTTNADTGEESDSSNKSETKQVLTVGGEIQTMNKQFQGLAMRMIALDAKIAEQPDNGELYRLAIETLSDAIEQVESVIDAGLNPYEADDTDMAIKKEMEQQQQLMDGAH